jgi:hypothetical protein
MTDTKTPQELLKEKYPDLLKNVSVAVGPGWVPLIERALDELDGASYEAEGELRGYLQGMTVLQIKEKFGGLRFYYRHADGSRAIEPIAGRIRVLENESQSTCESCGAPGALCDIGGWLSTACGDCAAARKAASKRGVTD